MDTIEKSKKPLAVLAAICSAVFLFAACEPRDDQPAEGPADDPAAPTYGEPDRPAGEQQDPADPQQQEQQQQEQQQDQQQQPEADPWEEDAGQTN